MTFIELALDLEATAGRALPPTPQSSLQGVALSLQERARVLRVAFVGLKRHSVGPPPFLGAFVNRAPSLVPLGAGPQAGLSRRPYFLSLGAMARQLAALQAYRERRMARNRCRVPQDGRVPQQAAPPQQHHPPGAQPLLLAAPAGPAPPQAAPQPATGGARRSRTCFASDYTPQQGTRHREHPSPSESARGRTAPYWYGTCLSREPHTIRLRRCWPCSRAQRPSAG